MKRIVVIMLALLMAGVSSAGILPRLEEIPVDEIYSPKGFDSNDDVEVIVSGWLPNLCYKVPQAKYEVKGNVIDIKIQARKYMDEFNSCAEMVVPFLKSVRVGLLNKGLYEVKVNGKISSSMFVNQASSDAIDDVVYANVEYVQKMEGKRQVVLKGYNPSDCFVQDRVEFIDNGKNVYSVLPVMEQVSDHCPMKMVPFEWEVEVPSKLKEDRVLLHVRAMDGKSVNSLFPNNIAK